MAGSDPSAGDPAEGPGGECGSRLEAVAEREATVSDFRAVNCESGTGAGALLWCGWLDLFAGADVQKFGLVFSR